MKRILRFVFPLFAIVVSAQETIPVYQQYLLDGQFLFNPAFYGNTDDIVVNGNFQKQFSKFEESPNIQTVGVHANVADRLGVGLSLFRDQNGPISANGITVGASYFLPLGDSGERADQFSFGTSINFYNQNYDFSQLNPVDPSDPNLYEGSNSIFIAYTNIGMQATYRNIFASVSAIDIALSNDRPIVNGIEPSPVKFFILAGYDWQLNDVFSVEPSVMVNLNTNSARTIDANILAKIWADEGYFAAGASYRMLQNKFGNEQLALSPVIKMKFNRFFFGAAYNITMSEIADFGGNSFTLSLGYDIENFINTRGFRF